MTAPYDSNLAQLIETAKTGDSGGVQSMASTMLADWRAQDPALADGLAYQLCAGIAAFSGDAATNGAMLDGVALDILKDQPLSPPVVYAVALLLMEDDDPEAARRLGSAWPGLRKERAAGVLAAWQAMRGQIDPDFNGSTTSPPAQPELPEGTNLPAGVAPSEIADETLRAQYQAALDAYTAKMAAYVRQSDLATYTPRMAREVQSYLILAYSTEPAALSEITQLMNQYMVPTGTMNQILQILTP